MKKYLLILFLFSALKNFPQQANQQTPQNLPGGTGYSQNIPNTYKKNKATGILLMSVGGLALIGGIGIFYNGLTQTIDDKNAYQSQLFIYNQTVSNSPYTNQQPPVEPSGTQHFPQMIGGIVLGASGAIAATVGTLIYIHGKHQQKRNNNLSVVVLPNAFRIAYKF